MSPPNTPALMPTHKRLDVSGIGHSYWGRKYCFFKDVFAQGNSAYMPSHL